MCEGSPRYSCCLREGAACREREHQDSSHDILRSKVKIMQNISEILRVLVSEFAHVHSNDSSLLFYTEEAEVPTSFVIVSFPYKDRCDITRSTDEATSKPL
jgi:hypothetical protein